MKHLHQIAIKYLTYFILNKRQLDISIKIQAFGPSNVEGAQ